MKIKMKLNKLKKKCLISSHLWYGACHDMLVAITFERFSRESPLNWVEMVIREIAYIGVSLKNVCFKVLLFLFFFLFGCGCKALRMSVTKCSMHAVLNIITRRRPPTVCAHIQRSNEYSVLNMFCEYGKNTRHTHTFSLMEEHRRAGTMKKDVFKWSQLPLQLRINHECVLDARLYESEWACVLCVWHRP